MPGHFLENVAEWAWRLPDNRHTPSTHCHTSWGQLALVALDALVEKVALIAQVAQVAQVA